MWWWVLIWVLLVVIAAIYLGSRIWGVWGSFKELTGEVSRASQTLAALEAEVDRIGDVPRAPPRVAVFDNPRDARRHRVKTRASLREERQARRAERLPGWARGSR